MEMAKGRSQFTSKLHTPPIGDSSNMASEVPAATPPAGCNAINVDNNSQDSSPDPAQQQLNSSVDSGIAVLEAESPTMRRRQRLHQCQRILQVLKRDQLTHQQLRDRLSKLANKKWRKEESSEDHACNVCCADLDLGSAKNYVTCCTCGKSVCRGPKCSDWRPKDAKWECQLCQSSKESLAHTSSWVAEQMSFNHHKFVYPTRARSEVYIPIVRDGNDSSIQFESVSQIGHTAHMDERAKIREYVEQIVAEMLGDNLDHVKVGQLSKSENYLQLFDKFHAKLSNLLINLENSFCALALRGDLPAIVNGHTNNNNNNTNADSKLADLSQTRLRSLIETIIAETLRSSSLSVSGAVSEISLDTRSHVSELANGNGLKRRHRTEHYFEPKIYQDLLATAVLNKIADKEGNTRLVAESTPDLSGRHIDENFNAEAQSTTSGSSIEPRSDCSLTDHEIGLDNGKSQSLQTDLERESVLSDYIAAHMVPLPDFSASVTESEDDIGSITSGMIGDGNWEDNWLFKKKRSSATHSSIGMLVPAPRENVRAQIGDKTTDEVSDLSEMGSDIDESSLDLLRCNDLNDRLLSKHLIGGQNTKLVLDELVDRTSLTSNTLLEENEPAFTETTNEFVVSPMAVPSDIKAPSPTPPPPPMIFQDDLLNEEPDHTPIAAQGESDELASLDSCTGFSTVEYIDEEQMHETVPSVIEILAAMALGPMLAVPASEQPGGMTPSEMHTLKELSDLALAEINARTVDLVHAHSLDIIEEENTESSEGGPEQHFDFVQPPPLEEITDPLTPGEQECVVKTDVLPHPPQLKLISEIEPPPPIELVEDIATATDSLYPAEVVLKLAPVEIRFEMKTDDVTAVESVEIVPEITSTLDIVSEDQSYVEAIIAPTTESEVVHVETVPKISVPFEIFLNTVVTAYSELHSVDPSEVIHLDSLNLEPPDPLERDPETVQTQEHQSVDLQSPIKFNHSLETDFVTGDSTENLSEQVPEMIAEPIAALSEPNSIPVPIDSGTQLDKFGTIEVDSLTTSVPIETVSEPKIVDPQLSVEADVLTQSAPVNSPEPLNNGSDTHPSLMPIDSEPQNIAIDSSPPVESTPIGGATVDSLQSVYTEIPATGENSISEGMLREATSGDANGSEADDFIIGTDSIAGKQPQTDETANVSASVEKISENQAVAFVVNVPESPQYILEEDVSTIETITLPYSSKVHVVTSVSSGVTETAPVEPSEPVNIVSQIHNVPVNSPEIRESVPQTKIVNLELENNPLIKLQDDLLTTSQLIPKSESCAIDNQAAQPVAVDPLPVVEFDTDVVALEPPSLVETDPETQTMTIDPIEMIPEPESIIIEKLAPIGRLAEAESIDEENQINPENHIEHQTMSDRQPTVPMDAIQPIEIVQVTPCNTFDLMATTEAVDVEHSEPGEDAFLAISEGLESVIFGTDLHKSDSHVGFPLPFELSLPAEAVDIELPVSVESLTQSEPFEAVFPTVFLLDIQSQSMEQPVHVENPAQMEIKELVSTAPVEIVLITTEDFRQAESIVESVKPMSAAEEIQTMVDSTADLEITPFLERPQRLETYSEHAEKETPESVEMGLNTQNVAVKITTSVDVTSTATETPKIDYVTAPPAAEERELNEAVEMLSVTADTTLPEETLSQDSTVEALEPPTSIEVKSQVNGDTGSKGNVEVAVPQFKEDKILIKPISMDVTEHVEVDLECVGIRVNVPEQVDLIQESIAATTKLTLESLEKDSQKMTDAVDLQEDNTEAEEKVDTLSTTEVVPDIIVLNPSSLVELSPEIQAMTIATRVPLQIVPEAELIAIEQPVPVKKLESIVVDSQAVVIDHLMEPITPADMVSEQNSRVVEPLTSTQATPVEVIACDPFDTVVEPVAVAHSPTIENTTPEEITQSVALDSTESMKMYLDIEIVSENLIQVDPKELSGHVELVSQIEASARDPEEPAKDATQVEDTLVVQATLTQVSVTDYIAVKPSVPVKQTEDSLGDPPESAQNVSYVVPLKVNQPASAEISVTDSVAVELNDPVERTINLVGNTEFVADTESSGGDNEIGVDPNHPAEFVPVNVGPETNQLEIETLKLKEELFTVLTMEALMTIDGKQSAVLKPLASVNTIYQEESTNLNSALQEEVVPQEQSFSKSLPTNVTIHTSPTDLETQPSLKPILETETVDVVGVKPVAVGTSAEDKSLESEKMVLKVESTNGQPLTGAESVILEPVLPEEPISVTEYISVDSGNFVSHLGSVPLSAPAAVRIPPEPKDLEPQAFEKLIPESVACTDDLLDPAQGLLQEAPVDMEDLSGMPIVADVYAHEFEPSPVEIVLQHSDANTTAPVEPNTKPETEGPSPMGAKSTADLQVVASEPLDLVPASPVVPVEFVSKKDDLSEETNDQTEKNISVPHGVPVNAAIVKGAPPIPGKIIQKEQHLLLGNNDPLGKDITYAPVEAPSCTASTPVSLGHVEQEQSNANEEPPHGEDNLTSDDAILKSVAAISNLSSDVQLACIDQEIQEIALDPATEDQLSSESIQSDESEPSTACETFNADGDSEQEFVSQRVLVLDDQRSLNTNTSSNNNVHTHLLLPLTQTNNPTSRSRRTNGKLTNGSLRWSGSYANELSTDGSTGAQSDDVADDDVVLLRRFVPGSIAEREVKKWYNAVEMPNNPYSPEALKQRISGTQERYMDVPNISPSAEQKALASALTENPDPPAPKTDYKRYSRDYYINNAPTVTDSTGGGKAATSSALEDVEDIVINEAQKANKPATERDPPQESVYKATPVQVLDESLDSQSNPSLYSLQTTTTNSSDESNTVRIYDFNKQETTVIRAAPADQQPSDSTTSSMESAQSALPSASSSNDSTVSNKRERPLVLQFGPGDSVPTIGSPASTPTRGSTPPAFRFLQPKRRLIDPSQVLSVDEDDVPETTTPSAEKPVIEDEVAHSMPSVKALAQAFLLTSKHTQPQRRWRAKVRIAAPPETPDKPNTSLAKRHKLVHAVSMAEVADESTIASDLSSLETDPSIHSEANPPVASPASPVPVRHGFLRSNIAFFENLKFK
ncbi:titin homolog isoform X11 [Drosophila teissieri]|uniref:titin homolog isoform X11 n=1 Tax=Drosophila teissieri TaxID=7243 RepID=UPI001CB9DABC|nr:titin homolog isoform X11 [Drosophila teissieri]